MNRAITSKEDILLVSKKIVAEQGIQEINMRSVAKQCGVAVGSVYNYFSSKEDLMIETIDAIWKEIIQESTESNPSTGFIEELENLFYRIKKEEGKYPYFFSIHAMGFAKGDKHKGRERMNQYLETIKMDLLQSLEQDNRIKTDFFSEKCSKEAFIDFVFSNLISCLIQKQKSCDVLIEIVKGAVYETRSLQN